MSADKHPADWLAETLEAQYAPMTFALRFDAASQLRRIPDLERLAAERLDQMASDRKQALRWRDECYQLRAALNNAQAGESVAQMAADASVLAEREACAALCVEMFSHGALEIADAIRARGQEGGAA